MSQYGIPDRLTLGETVRLPVMRVRTELVHTLKDGWRLSSSTAEITFTVDDTSVADAREVLEELQRQAHEVGQAEAELRNATNTASLQ